MDFIPKKVLLDIEARLNAPTPPSESSGDPSGSVMCVAGLRLAWWLENFLRAGAVDFQARLADRPPEEKREVGMGFGRFFLHRPLLQRLAPTGPHRPAGDHWALAREGSLLLLYPGGTDEAITGIYYLLPHRQIWPALLEHLDWPAILRPDDWTALEGDRAFSARSGREAVRAREETLRRWAASSTIPPDPQPVVLSKIEETVAPPSPVKQRGRKRKPSGQMSLFQESDTLPPK